jgi:hypothetical protein
VSPWVAAAAAAAAAVSAALVWQQYGSRLLHSAWQHALNIGHFSWYCVYGTGYTTSHAMCACCSIWTLVLHTQYAVQLAEMLADHAIKKASPLAMMANMPQLAAPLTETQQMARMNNAYVGGLFDAEGCVYFRHGSTGGVWHTDLCISISQLEGSTTPHLLPLLQQYMSSELGITSSRHGHNLYICSGASVSLFLVNIVLGGFSLRKGYKLYACFLAWFSKPVLVHIGGQLVARLQIAPVSGYPTGYKPTAPAGMRGVNAPLDVLHASRARLYMCYGPIKAYAVHGFWPLFGSTGQVEMVHPDISPASFAPDHVLVAAWPRMAQ